MTSSPLGPVATPMLYGASSHKLKAHRAVATRYDCDYTFRGTIDLASIKIWLRDPVP